MPTDKPKVSAYVPKPIKDCLVEFQKKRNISESQAVTIVLAEYFGLTQVIERTLDGVVVGGVTLSRLEKLELEVVELRDLIASLITSQSGSSPDGLPNATIESEQELSGSKAAVRKTQNAKQLAGKASNETKSSKLLCNPLGEPIYSIEPIQVEASPQVGKEKALEIKLSQDLMDSELNSSSQDESLVSGEEMVSSDDSLSDSESEPLLKLLEDNTQDELLSPAEMQPISGGKLSVLRFSLGESTVGVSKKQKKTPDEFTKWTRDKDPDGIGWKFVESPTKGYIPADELSSELRGKLLRWMREQGLAK